MACKDVTDAWQLLRDFPKEAYHCENLIDHAFGHSAPRRRPSFTTLFGLYNPEIPITLNGTLDVQEAKEVNPFDIVQPSKKG